MSFLQRREANGSASGIEPAVPGRRLAAPLSMLAAVLAWLWPIGPRMPVGGDVTAFSIGLMAELSRAIRAGRLPLWNADWGFGFPGLAESQMGVFYPPHPVLYGFLPVEAAYTASLVLHTLWAALGAYWLARRFGVSPWGSALSGFSWSASGMFLIHLPHQWGYTTGSWMPWILGIGWRVARAEGGRAGQTLRRFCLLSAVLALQILPGHFQFAFQTQVLLLALAAWTLVERPGGTRAARRSAATIAAALAAALALSAMQTVPTMQLARSASSQRTVEYLAAFPSTPLHLISYIAPNLFHVSPLWRPVAWDPFHAMPEEHRPYLGLVPLMLAVGALSRGLRDDRGTRLLAALLALSLALSLGPYLPGFSLLARLPGFSFFRAPARWGLGAELALAILAGKGFDAWRAWRRPVLGAARFAAQAAVGVGIVVAGVELAFLATEGPGMPAVASLYERASVAMPWSGDPSFRSVMQAASRGPTDPLILHGLMREGIDPRRAASMRLDRERYRVYVRELGEPAALLVALLAVVVVASRWPRWSGTALLAFAFMDLMLLSRHRAIQTAPIRPLIEQSTVLGRIAALSRGTRTLDGLRNLPMVAGAAPVAAYRTLDRPALANLVALAMAPRDGSIPADRIDAAADAVGASVRVFDPYEPAPDRAVVADDPALAEWQLGEWGVSSPTARRYRLDPSAGDGLRAFFVTGPVQDTSDPRVVLEILARSTPANLSSERPERFEVGVSADGPGTLIVSVLDDPEWRVTAESGGRSLKWASRRIFGTPGAGAWQAVAIPSAGRWRVSWTYEGRAATLGIEIAALSWALWGVALAASLRGRRFGVDRS